MPDLHEWDLERLLTDLEAKTLKRYRGTRREQYLRALLRGLNLNEIATTIVHTTYQAARTDVSHLYRDIELLTGEPENSVRGANLANVLDRHQYRRNTRYPQNLPAPTYAEFIGREREMGLLLQRLSPDHATHIITVDGIGGVGKSALVLEAARRCHRASVEHRSDMPIFDAIIHASAKQEYLSPYGILLRPQAQRNLHDIFREIANTLDDQTIIQASPEDQIGRVRQSLASKNRVLLIVDNMETMEESTSHHVLSFLYDLPATVKVVITSRRRLGVMPISLPCLARSEGVRLIQQQAEEKQLSFTTEETSQLYEKTGGIPIAIVYSIGQVSNGYSLEFVLERLASNTGDLANFCFTESVQRLRNQPAYQLLLALAIFSEPPTLNAVAEVAGLGTDSAAVTHGLPHLQQLSLINQENGRYTMVALTHEYVLAELEGNPEFASRARERWLTWYKALVERYGGEDWARWIQYDRLKAEEGNLLAVLHWCRDQERYADFRDLWLPLNHYANLYGYWDDQLDSLQWLIAAAERRGDWATFVKVMNHKSWLLIRNCSSEALEEADKILRQSWSLRSYADLCTQADLVENIVRLRIRQKRYREACNWLDREEKLVIDANLEAQQHIRYFIPIQYHRAEVSCLESNYDTAKRLFQGVIESAAKIEWYRVINSAQNWVADIAIKQRDFCEAERLLQTGLAVAEQNKNRRRIARYQRSYAYLNHANGLFEESRRWADQAIDGFNRLGMLQDAREMKFFT